MNLIMRGGALLYRGIPLQVLVCRHVKMSVGLVLAE